MSQAADDASTLDIREQIARIDRAIVENAKFQAETGKLNAEAQKLRADRWFAPIIATGTFIAAVGGLVTGVLALLLRASHG